MTVMPLLDETASPSQARRAERDAAERRRHERGEMQMSAVLGDDAAEAGRLRGENEALRELARDLWRDLHLLCHADCDDCACNAADGGCDYMRRLAGLGIEA